MTKKQSHPRLPDLNPCDYFTLGYLKSKVYKPFPQTLDDLIENITREIKKINSVLESTFLNFTKRCNLLIEKLEVILIKYKKKILTTQFPFNLSFKWCLGLKNPI